MKIAKQITKRFDENDMARKKTDTDGNQTCSGTECFGWIAVWMMKTQRE